MGVPFGRIPWKPVLCQCAAKCIQVSLKRSQSTSPLRVVKGRSKRLTGCVKNTAYPFRGFDGPQVVELDNEAVGFKKWGAGDLALIVESDWRTRKIECSARGDFVVPGDLAVLDPQVAD